MPVWHERTRAWVNEGKLVLLGVTQEQHPERCRLFAQWKQFDWPILHDPINVLGSTAVPIVLAIDEHGIVRSTRPNVKTFERDFLAQSFADDAAATPERLAPAYPPDFDALSRESVTNKSAENWRQLGDGLTLWGDTAKVNDAIAAYRAAVEVNPKDGSAWFRLGVNLRRRYETPGRNADDFRAAVAAWDRALELNPNQYIWRRRIQQYGPRLDKPYPFYDWVEDAEKAVRARGETPVALPVRPDGAEIALPLKTFDPARATAKNPDPAGKIIRDQEIVTCESVVVPARVKPGETVRVHLTFRLKTPKRDHWNNEADPLRVWVDAPADVSLSERLLLAKQPTQLVSEEPRTLEFELRVPAEARDAIKVPVFALYHVCDDLHGQCRFFRLDHTVTIPVK